MSSFNLGELLKRLTPPFTRSFSASLVFSLCSLGFIEAMEDASRPLSHDDKWPRLTHTKSPIFHANEMEELRKVSPRDFLVSSGPSASSLVEGTKMLSLCTCLIFLAAPFLLPFCEHTFLRLRPTKVCQTGRQQKRRSLGSVEDAVGDLGGRPTWKLKYV